MSVWSNTRVALTVQYSTDLSFSGIHSGYLFQMISSFELSHHVVCFICSDFSEKRIAYIFSVTQLFQADADMMWCKDASGMQDD